MPQLSGPEYWLHDEHLSQRISTEISNLEGDDHFHTQGTKVLSTYLKGVEIRGEGTGTSAV